MLRFLLVPPASDLDVAAWRSSLAALAPWITGAVPFDDVRGRLSFAKSARLGGLPRYMLVTWPHVAVVRGGSLHPATRALVSFSQRPVHFFYFVLFFVQVSLSCRAAMSEGRPFPWLPSAVPDVDDDESASEGACALLFFCYLRVE